MGDYAHIAGVTHDGGSRARYAKRWRKRRSLLMAAVVAPDQPQRRCLPRWNLRFVLFTFDNGDIVAQMGTPTDCVYSGAALMRPRPDIVVSGINAPNLGDDAIYSTSPRRKVAISASGIGAALNGGYRYYAYGCMTCALCGCREPLRTGRILNA